VSGDDPLVRQADVPDVAHVIPFWLLTRANEQEASGPSDCPVPVIGQVFTVPGPLHCDYVAQTVAHSF
jgi:hypothetical protein